MLSCHLYYNQELNNDINIIYHQNIIKTLNYYINYYSFILLKYILIIFKLKHH